MKKISELLVLAFLTIWMITFTGCKKDAVIPTLSTTVVSLITETTATTGGIVTSSGGTDVTALGVCWSTTHNPTVAGNKTVDESGAGSFTSSISGLTANTVYYVRAYATNSAGTAYGNEISFTTSQITVAIVTSAEITEITDSSAVSGGNITSDGGSRVTDWGVCWSTSEHPTTDDTRFSFTGGSGGSGVFTCNLTGLIPGTTYFVRAYAVNIAGTAYGNEISFTTSLSNGVSTLTTAPITDITVASAASGFSIAENTEQSKLIAGLCWGTSANPTTSNSKTTDFIGSGVTITGDFHTYIYGLQPSTKYFVRSYVTTESGTAYGNELSFTTSAVSAIIFNPGLTYGSVSDIDGNIYKTIQIGTQLWMAENLKTTRYNDGTSLPNVTDDTEWTNLITGGYCWYDNNASTFKTTYGALYNWYAVTDNRKICPTGWHVPTSSEWNTMSAYLGGESLAGGKVKETGTAHWLTPNAEATNETGFTGLPGGGRYLVESMNPDKRFMNFGYVGSWWSTTSIPDGAGAYLFSVYNSAGGGLSNEDLTYKFNGISVRCLKDN